MDYKLFIKSAEEYIELGDSSGGEEHYRNAISRAYYGLYHCLLGIYNSLPPEYKKGGNAHEKVIASLVSHPEDEYKSLGHNGSACRAHRKHADYHLDRRISRKKAVIQIELCSEAVRCAEKLALAS